MHFREVRPSDLAELSVQDLIGQRVSSVDTSLAPNFWVFCLERATLQVEALWRLVSRNSVVITGYDHGQKFGYKTPVDAASRFSSTVGDHRVTAARLGPVIGDLVLEFGPLVSLQIVVSSAGYESWGLNREDGSQLIAVSGGRVALFRSDVK